MGGMPYILEKGAVFTVYEDYLQSLDRRLTMLRDLRNPHVASWRSMPLRTTSLNDQRESGVLPPPDQPDELEDHARDHWRGSPTFNPDTCEWDYSTEGFSGWWSRWNGPADAILRETFIRAIEVSIGRPHQATHQCEPGPEQDPSSPQNEEPTDRHWPIEILWVCGASSLQGWVTWRKHGEGPDQGQVTIVLTTPPTFGPGHNMYPNPTPNRSNPEGRANYKAGPGSAEDIGHSRGIWLIGARETEIRPTNTTAAGHLSADVRRLDKIKKKDWKAILADAPVILPDSRYVTVDPSIVVVRPSEDDGGVLNTPRTYEP